ncbi:uncharacterized protein Z520_04330 [Fonsecaea multimorphosa CBS 102226]|uniref:Carboxylesterase type B domain-containing protein n=1 Tax=Fonsecaea multimorphosa CBS 102226 TaxID=1442371 RepID=A0A0D2HCR8_9EURO|nr:uncharacterized protein Z520_04330 [Fonsecaea multimorphosa CBS 102226]KIX99695.1 hypothetical protein Z520_04330 [Fonsecaea multimorphosa CBS 102226]OAL26745.1 hypothetical protein AYO22_04098 [Fonsecaea multimorphosa]
MKSLVLFVFNALAAVAGAACISSQSLSVTASTGIFTGLLNPTYPSVREFRNVPYALSPTGERRWLPPQKLPASNKNYDATQYPLSCPQFVTKVKSVWSEQIPEWLIFDGGESTSAGLYAYGTSEDCLSLAIWTPANATAASKLPVIMFMTGGGMVTGGVNIPIQIPAEWVARSQSHIVVTINYRVNIMGFPNAAGLATQNLGLRDQRAALEWIQTNIASFGGDPTATTLWGQSAGSRSTDYYNFAYYKDPIARGFFMQSGTALSSTANSDVHGTNFTFVARNLGCDFPNNKTAELECMRRVPVSQIENFVGQYQDNSSTTNTHQAPIAFTPIADEDVVFSNYTARYRAGQVARVPAIISNTANEYASLAPYPLNNLTAGPNPQAVLAGTLNTVCGISNSSLYRNDLNISTFRYVYGGNFSNINPLWWMGAYHASDLAMMFGTYGIRPGAVSRLETETSAAMQDYVLAFVKDPTNGPRSVNWTAYDHRNNGGQMILFGADGKAVQQVNGTMVEGVCYGEGMYDSTP